MADLLDIEDLNAHQRAAVERKAEVMMGQVRDSTREENIHTILAGGRSYVNAITAEYLERLGVGGSRSNPCAQRAAYSNAR